MSNNVKNARKADIKFKDALKRVLDDANHASTVSVKDAKKHMKELVTAYNADVNAHNKAGWKTDAIRQDCTRALDAVRGSHLASDKTVRDEVLNQKLKMK